MVPTQSKVKDLADSDPKQFVQEIIVQVNFETHSGLNSQILNWEHNKSPINKIIKRLGR